MLVPSDVRGWETVTTSGASYIARVERGNFMAQVLQKGEGVIT